MSEIKFRANVTSDWTGDKWGIKMTHIDGRRLVLDNAMGPGARFDVTLTPVEPELEPCPFCKGFLITQDWDDRGKTHMRCDICGACGPQVDENISEVKAKAIAAWNRRAE